VRRVFVKPALRSYVAMLSKSSREHNDVLVGISVRGSQQLMHAAQAFALISHRSYVLPDDVQGLAASCLSHRLVIKPEARLAGVAENAILQNIVKQQAVPLQ